MENTSLCSTTIFPYDLGGYIWGCKSMCEKPRVYGSWFACRYDFYGLCPSSNIVMTEQAHGNVALTVVQSTLGNLLRPFRSPLLIQMYTGNNAWHTLILLESGDGGYGEIYKRVFKQLGLSIFPPLERPILIPLICSLNGLNYL